MPKNEANQGNSCFYSLNLGQAHWIFFNTEVYLDDTLKGAQQTETNWLLKDLEQANRERDIRPWIILMTHHPLYCSVDPKLSPQCGSQSVLFRGLFEDIFVKYGLDLLIEAHVHNYERKTPIYNNVTVKSDYDDFYTHINPKAPVSIITGNAGNKRGHNDPIPPVKKLWSVFMNEDYGYGEITVFNSTHLYWKQYSAFTLTEIDHLWIIKNHTRYDSDLLK